MSTEVKKDAAVSAAVAQVLRADGRAAYFAEGSIGAFAKVFQPFMRTEKSAGDFEAFRAHRAVWCIGYEMARRNLKGDAEVEISDAAIDAFNRRIQAAKKGGFLTGDTPRSQSAAAVQKAKQRAEAAKIEGTPAQWRAKAAELLKKGDTAGADKAIDNARRLEKVALRQAADKAKAEIKAAAEALTKAIAVLRSAGDLKALHALATAAQKYAKPHVEKKLAAAQQS